MFKLFVLGAMLSLTSFTPGKPVSGENLPFCEGVKSIIQKMKTGQEADLQGMGYDDDGDWYLTNIDLNGWSGHLVVNSRQFSFITETEDDMTMDELQTKFADIRAELITCMKLDRKKATRDELKRFSTSSGTIRIALSLIEGVRTDYCLSLWISKSKR